MNDLRKDISEAIAKNLPAQVAGELADYLAQAKKDAAEVIGLKKDLEHKQDLLSQAIVVRERLEAQESAVKSKAAELAKRETEIAVREKKADLLDQEVKFRKEQVDLVKEMYKVPFANRTLRESLHGSENIPVQTSPGYQSVQSMSKSTTKEVSET